MSNENDNVDGAAALKDVNNTPLNESSSSDFPDTSDDSISIPGGHGGIDSFSLTPRPNLRPPATAAPAYSYTGVRFDGITQDNRRKPIDQGNHDKAWNDPPMFSLDVNTRPPPRGTRGRLTERVGFPLTPGTGGVSRVTDIPSTATASGTNDYNPPSLSRPPVYSFMAPPILPMAVPRHIIPGVIPAPPPPPPGSGDSQSHPPLFYGNLPHAMFPPAPPVQRQSFRITHPDSSSSDEDFMEDLID